MSENARTFLKALYGFDATVRRVDPDSWSNPSPCEGWQAVDIVGHNLGMGLMVSGFTRGIGAKQPSEAPADPVTAWQPHFDDLLVALDTKGAISTEVETPWGEMAVDSFIGFAWVDPLIHTWDLAKATGQVPVMDAGLVERAYRQLERAGDSLRGPGRFGAAVAETDEMTMVDRFIAISGRDPHWS
jgi:uncharacterized protein (TIGR03086 family)